MIVGFDPIIDKDCQILILGSMPGVDSLRKQEYYGHSRNQFWKIIFSLYNSEPIEDYEEKKKFLLEKGIALWDVLKGCQREGSLDSNIKNSEENDFQSFFKQYPKIERIYFNGKKAEKLYRRLVVKDMGENNMELIGLPSTSPAYTIGIKEKLKDWVKIID
ncbi:MAG: DNA-deoxyinosine glycosylase [Tissierella sp.]|uniref:DNA-deoxyinosine glycosylase n=1 Tax=Tissierella sp. TaxID=41274 RepID=UPI003F9C06FA